MEVNMSEKTERIRKISNLLYILCLVLAVALLACSVVSIALGIMTPDVEELRTSSVDHYGSVDNAVVEYMFSAVSLILMGVVTLMAALMFRSMSRSYTPFLNANPATLMIMGHVTLFSAIALPIFRYVVTTSMGCGPFTLDIVGSFTMIVIAVIIYCASLIFEYGAELQKESDETL